MTLSTVLIWSITRSLLLALIALPTARMIAEQAIAPESKLLRKCFTVAALFPLFVPDLLTGFSYRLVAMKISDSWFSTELLYAVLLSLRIIALQVAAFLILPDSAINQDSLHSWRLMPRRDVSWRWQYARMLLLGPWRVSVIAFAVSTVFAFQEFETAALIQVDRHPITFSVWLFDAHAAGEPLSRSIRFAAGSLGFQALLLLPLFWFAFTARRTETVARSQRRLSLAETSLAGSVAAISLAFICLWPVWSNVDLLVNGLTSTVSAGMFARRIDQIVLSVVTAAVSSVSAMMIAALLRWLSNRWLTVVCVLPGLCGSLVLSLGLVALFQTSVLRNIYDTTIPLLVGQTLLILPRAVLLDLLLQSTSTAESLGSAKLLRWASDVRAVTGGELVWRLQHRRKLIVAAVLTHWLLWDVTTASMLRSVSFEPVVTRLYNEMHYGRSETLIGITFLTLCVPLVLYACIVGGRRCMRV